MENVFILIWLLTFAILMFIIAHKSAKKYNLSLSILIVAIFYRVGMYFLYTSSKGADYEYYVNIIRSDKDLVFNFGTSFIPWVNGWMHYLPLPEYYIGYFLPSMLIGFIGFIFFYRNILFLHPKITNTWLWVILLLPGVHLWSISIGKDALMFFLLNYYLFLLLRVKRFLSAYQVLTLLIVLCIRPHISVVILMAIVTVLFISSKTSVFKKALVVGVFIGASIYFLPFLSDFLRVDLTNTEEVLEKMDSLSSYGEETASTYVDLKNKFIFTKVITYLFRPFILEVRNISVLPFALENLILLILTWPLFNPINVRYIFHNRFFFFLLLVGVLIPIILSQGLSNYGVFFRQKWMALPFLITAVLMLKDKSKLIGVTQ